MRTPIGATTEDIDVNTAERRRTKRIPAGDNRARLEWADGPDFLDTPARLVDISQGGAGFVAERTPPDGRPVWLRLESPRLTGWVSARVARLDGPTVGGLSFESYCPHDMIAGLT
jgi:PilZ domain